MPWGVFIIDEDDWPHVVPTDDEGYARSPHVPSMDCACHPHEDDGVIVHEEIN